MLVACPTRPHNMVNSREPFDPTVPTWPTTPLWASSTYVCIHLNSTQHTTHKLNIDNINSTFAQNIWKVLNTIIESISNNKISNYLRLILPKCSTPILFQGYSNIINKRVWDHPRPSRLSWNFYMKLPMHHSSYYSNPCVVLP